MRVLIYTFLVIIFDQMTKYITRTFMTLHESIPVIGDFFRLTYVENSGIAFGINFAGGPLFFTVGAGFATVGVAVYLWMVRSSHLSLRLSLALILGGAVGNLIDRLLFGRVVDFLDFSIAGYHWPVFNIADSSVTVGITLFLYVNFFSGKFSRNDPVDKQALTHDVS